MTMKIHYEVFNIKDDIVKENLNYILVKTNMEEEYYFASNLFDF